MLPSQSQNVIVERPVSAGATLVPSGYTASSTQLAASATSTRSPYRVGEVPAEERLRQKPLVSFQTRASTLASILVLSRFLTLAFAFISIILSWIARFDYENVVLGIVSLYVLSHAISMRSDLGT